MSNEERMAAIGRMVPEHGELRRKRSVVIAELRAAGEIMKHLGYELGRQGDSSSIIGDEKVRVHLSHDAAARYVAKDAITGLLDDLKELNARVREGDARLKELGVSG